MYWMLKMIDDYCCPECDFWESKIEMHIENEIKEAQLVKVAKKKSLKTKLIIPTNIKATGGKYKTGGYWLGGYIKKKLSKVYKLNK